MKPFPPAMREKRRYVVFKIKSNEKFSEKEIKKALWELFLEYFGLLNLSKSSFMLVSFDEKSQFGIIRFTNEFVYEALGILAFLERVSNKNLTFHIIGVSGTIKKARSLAKV